jgi:hypothetical protein
VYTDEPAATECRACPPPQRADDDCASQVCAGGEVVDVVDATEVPDDAVDCTVDRCDKDGQAVHEPDRARCDDRDPCTRDSCTPDGCEHEARSDCAPPTTREGGAAGGTGDAGGAGANDDDGGITSGGTSDVTRDAGRDGGPPGVGMGDDGGVCGCRIGVGAHRAHGVAPLLVALACVALAGRYCGHRGRGLSRRGA